MATQDIFHDVAGHVRLTYPATYARFATSISTVVAVGSVARRGFAEFTIANDPTQMYPSTVYTSRIADAGGLATEDISVYARFPATPVAGLSDAALFAELGGGTYVGVIPIGASGVYPFSSTTLDAIIEDARMAGGGVLRLELRHSESLSVSTGIFEVTAEETPLLTVTLADFLSPALLRRERCSGGFGHSLRTDFGD